MARFVKGNVVIIPFPFSNAANAKNRPALVVATLPGDDIIVCMMTSQAIADSDAIPLLTPTDFQHGRITQNSNIRPDRLFTADHNNAYLVGTITAAKMAQVTQALVQIFTR